MAKLFAKKVLVISIILTVRFSPNVILFYDIYRQGWASLDLCVYLLISYHRLCVHVCVCVC